MAAGADAAVGAAAEAELVEKPDAQPQLTSSSRPRKSREKTDHDRLTELMGISIGFVAVVMGIGIGMLAIWCDYKKRHELIAACHQERLAALEKGLELPPFPPEPFSGGGPPKPFTPGGSLKAGLVWLAIGIGLAIFLSLQDRGRHHPSVSAIPIAIGVAYLIFYVVEGRKHKKGTGETNC